ncbi:MAG: AAA family ATPase [Clostridia bacterium]|nr:AAA family ATPase [Clostridia bacterium]
MEKFRLNADQLTCKIPIEDLRFETTEDLTPLYEMIGQERAAKAMEFGLNIQQRGYNIYVAGGWGTGRNTYVRYITSKKVLETPAPNDWIYVNNFKDPRQPIAIALKNGEGRKVKKSMARTIEFIQNEIAEAFISKEYENTKAILRQEYSQKNAVIIEELNEIGKKYNFAFTQTERGLVSIPLKNNKPMSEDEYRHITEEEYEQLSTNSNKLTLETVDLFNKLRSEEELYLNKLDDLDAKMGRKIVAFHIGNLIKRFGKNEKLKEYFESVIEDIVENLEEFKEEEPPAEGNPLAMLQQQRPKEDFFIRYDINLFVDNGDKDSAPVEFEINPTFVNLIGNIEYRNEYGAWKTDFTQIKPGALHLANGGYLIIQTRDLLTAPYAWQALKRALINKEVSIENIGKQSGVNATQTLKPQAIPLDVKVIIVGDFYTYNILFNYDEEFRKLFKVLVDFDDEVERNRESVLKMARFIASYAEKDNIKYFDKFAVAEIVNYATRMASNKDKLSAHLNVIVDIIYEADTWANIYGSKVVGKEHVQKALEEQKNRTNRFQRRLLENFEDGTYLIDVDGEKVGEINGLAVLGTGIQSFGKPSKITVSTYRGKAGLINIEREANQSGPSHDKGVMILNGFMGHTYAQDKPLTLSASIVFEQSYSGVDGDSASSTELYAILSSLSGLPIDQSFAVTGSVNQRGEIQPIGGVNEKIEGFYAVCKLKGLTGRQGVIIPHQNVKNLMLCQEVVQAVEDGKFNIYAISHINQGLELLMNKKAGERQKNGKFPRGTIHYLVDKKLEELAAPIMKRATDGRKAEMPEKVEAVEETKE